MSSKRWPSGNQAPLHEEPRRVEGLWLTGAGGEQNEAGRLAIEQGQDPLAVRGEGQAEGQGSGMLNEGRSRIRVSRSGFVSPSGAAARRPGHQR